MMLWEPSRCCCFSLRTGSLILGSLNIIMGSISVINVIGVFLLHDIHGIIKEVCEEELEEGETVAECIDMVTPIFVGILSTSLIFDTLAVAIGISLVYGIVKNKTRFMLPFMGAMTFGIVFYIICALVALGFLAVAGLWSGVFIIAIIFGGVIFLCTYFLLVIRALYLQLRREKGRTHLALTEEGYNSAMSDSVE